MTILSKINVNTYMEEPEDKYVFQLHWLDSPKFFVTE